MGDVWRGLEVVEAATRVGSEMLVRCCEGVSSLKIFAHVGSFYSSYFELCTFLAHVHVHECANTTFWCFCMQGDSLQNLSSGLDTVSYRVPLGVCAGIGTWQFELSSCLIAQFSYMHFAKMINDIETRSSIQFSSNYCTLE